jgi:hypothetical protein
MITLDIFSYDDKKKGFPHSNRFAEFAISDDI